jgi:uncharacterized membrane protein YhaH (DUF805 family)
MDFQALYTTTDGRISRKTWWMGVIGLIVATIVLVLVLNLLGLGLWGSFIASLIVAYPNYCLSVKRRHDRNGNGQDVIILLAASLILGLLPALGIGIQMTDLGNGMVVPMPAMWLNILNLILAVFGIYMLVQLGFLKGTDGANEYGADPLAGGVAATA